MIVVSGTVDRCVRQRRAEGLRDLGRLASLYLAGAAADEALARRVRAGYLDDDLVVAARELRARLG